MSFPLLRKHWSVREGNSVRVAIMPGNIYKYFAQHGITVTETSLGLRVLAAIQKSPKNIQHYDLGLLSARAKSSIVATLWQFIWPLDSFTLHTSPSLCDRQTLTAQLFSSPTTFAMPL